MKSFLLSLALVNVVFNVAFAQPRLEVVNSGFERTEGEVLMEGSNICPASYTRGFTIRCYGEPSDNSATFYVNGARVTTENNAPFFINGIRPDSFPKNWVNYPKSQEMVDITCDLASGTVSASISIDCRGQGYKGPSPDDPAGTMFFRQAGMKMSRSIKVVSGMTFCPTDVYDSMKISIFCRRSLSANSARFRINKMLYRKEERRPFFLAGDDNGVPNSWDYKEFVGNPFDIRCNQDDGTRTPRLVRGVKISCDDRPETPTDCTFINAGNVRTLSNGWERVSDGVAYRRNDNSRLLTGAGEAPLYYEFSVKETSRYAIVAEFTTAHHVFHNDLWVKMDGGIHLRNNYERYSTEDWVKGYHNEDGRVARLNGGDFPPLSFSTAQILEPRKTYKLAIGGRSSKVVLHRILLFPCTDAECQQEAWKSLQDRCM